MLRQLIRMTASMQCTADFQTKSLGVQNKATVAARARGRARAFAYCILLLYLHNNIGEKS